MAVPKKRTTKATKGQRRSHQALGQPGLSQCPNCGAANIAHTVCRACGFYGGKQILKVG
jgi:large subunit ribosomal protein L32